MGVWIQRRKRSRWNWNIWKEGVTVVGEAGFLAEKGGNMRILSQKGLRYQDLPYEEFVFGILRDTETDKICIVARKDSTISPSCFPLNGIMAEYSTEELAGKEMSQLRAYAVKSLMAGMNAEEISFLRQKLGLTLFAGALSPYFRFPAEYELSEQQV